MSSSAIQTPVYQALASNIKNADASTPIYSAGAWDFKNAAGTTTLAVSSAGGVTVGVGLQASLHPHVIKVSGLPAGSAVSRDALDLVGVNGNTDRLITRFIRTGTGSDWDDCTWSIIRRVDLTDMGFVRFGQTDTAPVEFGRGTTVAGYFTGSGAWTFGPTSGQNEVSHFFGGYSTTNSADIFQVKNRETTTASDSTFVMRLIKGSATNTTSQNLMGFLINNGATGSGQINANGASACAFGTYSDLRLKENILPLQGELSKVLALNPVEFDYKTGGHQIGFIAQEMEEVYPDSVNILGETEEMKTVTGWDKTTARLVKAIQELEARLAALEAK
jgi:hypothetical protein